VQMMHEASANAQGGHRKGATLIFFSSTVDDFYDSVTIAWGFFSAFVDVDKCLSNPCPALATCNNTHGSYICLCPLGYELEKGKCNLGKKTEVKNQGRKRWK